MPLATPCNDLVLLGQDSLTQTWLAKGDEPGALATRAAIALVRHALHSHPGSALARIASALQINSGSPPRGEDATWAVLEAALLRRRLTVHVVSRPLPRADPGPAHPPFEPPAPPAPLDPIVDDDRVLFIVRCDPELLDDAPLKFEYLIRGLVGQSVKLRILSERFPGQVVHERMLTAAQTEERVHADTWDGIVTANGELQGERLPAEYGPCVLEIVHDDSFRDDARFTLSRVVLVMTLDGFFHTGSAMFLPSRPARGGIVASRPFDDPDEHQDWLGPYFDESFQHPASYELRETIGLSSLAYILSECGGDHSQRGLILAGHTSAAGTNALNDELSDARARCVWALLIGDVGEFESSLEHFWVVEDAYVMLRYCAQRCAWPCDPGPCDPGEARASPNHAYREAVREFQTHYNEAFGSSIDVDGEVGPQTRGGFFAVYQALLEAAFGGQSGLDHHRGQLRVHGSAPTLACGERYLASARRPGQGIDDRRVEALLFLPNEPAAPDSAAIYEHDTFRFAEWMLDLEPQSPGVGNQALERLEPPPASSELNGLHVYEPFDPDDAWDFLNAFLTVTNRAGVYDG